jgi:putative ABC transport system ATP-binding protein
MSAIRDTGVLNDIEVAQETERGLAVVTDPATAVPLILIRELVKTYGSGDASFHALAGVSLTINRGEFVAIMGPSGSGKSTLMNILGALDRPTSGSYVLDGEDISTLDRAELAAVRNEKIGFVFQSFNLLPRTTAVKQVMLPMLYSRENRLSPQEREERAIVALEAVGLGERLDHKPNELSGGQQQRVAIARALILHPPLLFADEPTGNLDTKASVEVMEILKSLHAGGTTVVMVTHEPDIAAHAKRVICVHDGLVVSDGLTKSTGCLERDGMRGKQ